MHSPTSLRLDSVTVNFGGLRALSQVSIEIHPGEVVGVIGPNGAGKTTLFNVLSGLVLPTSGSLSIGGRPHPWPKVHQLAGLGLARTLQGVGLFNELSVRENLLVGATHSQRQSFIKALLGLDASSERALRAKVEEILVEFDLTSYANELASALPYPIAKKVALARALMSDPATLLLDEPAGGLGVEDIAWLKEFVLHFRKENSVLLVEHHMDVIMSVCDRIYVLNFGELIAHGTPAEIRENPAVITAYLGSEAEI
jgi:branched-chain amino acid transport system ATP-binding protein